MRVSREQAEKTRQAIIETSFKLLCKTGYSGFRISDLTSALGLTRGAVYWYYQGKDELIPECIGHFYFSSKSRTLMDDLLSTRCAVPDTTLKAFFSQRLLDHLHNRQCSKAWLMAQGLQYDLNTPKVVLRRLQEHLHWEVCALMRGCVAAAERKTLADYLDPEEAGIVLYAKLTGFVSALENKILTLTDEEISPLVEREFRAVGL